MVTDSQNLYNLRTAGRNVASRHGITDTVNIADFEQRKRYIHDLATEVLRYPASFNETTYSTALAISKKDYGQLQAADFSFADFGDAFAEEVKTTLPSIGNKLLIAAVVIVAVYVTVKAFQSAPEIKP